MFFRDFPLIAYSFNINGKNELRILKDISLNIRVRKEVLDNITLYDQYDIQDGETPDKIAARVYGNPNYHWVIMLTNNRFNAARDFPLSQQMLEEYVNQKYGEANRDMHHMLFGQLHYETPDGTVVDADTELATPVSNYDYEFRENEKKRKIRLINPKMIDQVVSELEKAFSEYTNDR